MRGKNPDYIDASCREQARAAASKFEAERESYRAESKADERESVFNEGCLNGALTERNRLLTALTRLEQETAALWQEGTPVTKAVAAYTAAVRRVVEGRT